MTDEEMEAAKKRRKVERAHQLMRRAAMRSGYTEQEADEIGLAFAMPKPRHLSSVEGPGERFTVLGFANAVTDTVYAHGTTN